MLENLIDLEDHLRMQEVAVHEDVILSPRVWTTLVSFVSPYNIVAGSPDEPPFFWFLGRRIRQGEP